MLKLFSSKMCSNKGLLQSVDPSYEAKEGTSVNKSLEGDLKSLKVTSEATTENMSSSTPNFKPTERVQRVHGKTSGSIIQPDLVVVSANVLHKPLLLLLALDSTALGCSFTPISRQSLESLRPL